MADAARASVTIADERVMLDATTWLRCRADQDAGHVQVRLDMCGGANQASVQLHPHRLGEVVRMLTRWAAGHEVVRARRRDGRPRGAGGGGAAVSASGRRTEDLTR